MLVYVKDTPANESYIIMLQQGTGDNLLDEDIEEGYFGYINYYVDRFVGHYDDDCGFRSHDCGMYLCTEQLAAKWAMDDEPEIWFPTHKRKKASHGKGNRNKSKKRRKAHAKNH